MKFLLVLTLVYTATMPLSYAKVEQHAEESLSDDLNFKLHDDTDSVRKVASEDKEDDSNDLDSSDDQQRDIASDAQDTSSTIKYWKY
jgi:hypothetical protein